MAAQGDEVALDLVRWAGRELGELAVTVISQLGFQQLEFDLVQIGSMFDGIPLLTEEMKSARAKYADLDPMMNELDRVMFVKTINEKLAEVEPGILQGAASEYKAAIDFWHESKKQLQREKNREVARWEPARLNAELETVERIINSIIKSSTGCSLESNVLQRIKTMFDEAQASGYIYKMRAAAEIAQGLPSMVGQDFEDRALANRLSKQAQEAAKAVEGINQAKSTLFEVDERLGYTRPNGEVGSFTIHKELIRIKSNASGEILDIIPLDQVYVDGA